MILERGQLDLGAAHEVRAAHRIYILDEHVQDRRVLTVGPRRVLEAEHLAPPRLERLLFRGRLGLELRPRDRERAARVGGAALGPAGK